MLTHSKNNTYYTGGNMSKQLPDITVNTFNILCKINDIMQEVIHLKDENRSIGQRINHLNKLDQLNIKEIQKVVKIGNHSLYQEYEKKNDSNFNLMYLLYKLQNINSETILKHRNKIQQLRNGLV